MKILSALASVRTLFLDTAPVIYYVEGPTPLQALVDVVFQERAKGRLTLVTSSITLGECLIKPFKVGDHKLVTDFRDLITSGAGTSYVGVDPSAERAAELAAKYSLALPDALQVASAIRAHCDALLTNDAKLKRVKELTILSLADLEL